MAEKFYFGVPGAIAEVRAPESGMRFGLGSDTEVTPLISGGRSVWRAPVTYKTFNMSWKSNSSGLRHLIDLYNGQFGPGPFFLTDPTASQENVLPPRWANAWQLAHQANGWCRPIVQNWPAPTTPTPTQPRVNRRVLFTQAASGSSIPTEGVVRMRVIRVPGKPYFFSAYGSATGGAAIKVWGYNATTNSWQAVTTFTDFSGTVAQIIPASNTTYSMIELDISMPLSSTLTLYGMALGTIDHTQLQNIVRRNLIPNGSFEVDYATWTLEGTTATVVSGFPQMVKNGIRCLQALSDGTRLTPGISVSSSLYRPPVAAGQWFGVRAFVATEQTNYQTRVQFTFRDAAGAVLGATVGSTWDATPFYAGGWQQAVGLAPAGTVSVAAYVLFRNGNDTATAVPSGKRLWVDTVAGAVGATQAEVEALLAEPYFDGNTIDDPASNRWFRWVGATGASASVLLSQAPSDFMPTGEGVGALQFTNSADGNLVSQVIDRLGLSLDMTEVQNVESKAY